MQNFDEEAAFKNLEEAVKSDSLKTAGADLPQKGKPMLKRNEILNAAEQVFYEIGYSAASVNDILNLVGIAKGTFYYYFESKEEALDAIIARRGDAIVSEAHAAAEAKLPIGERIIEVLTSLQPLTSLFSPFFDPSAATADGIIFLKTLTDTLDRVSPILEAIITEGVEQGIFEAPFPLESAKILIAATHALFSNPFLILEPDETQRLFSALIISAERILGAKDGSLLLIL